MRRHRDPLSVHRMGTSHGRDLARPVVPGDLPVLRLVQSFREVLSLGPVTEVEMNRLGVARLVGSSVDGMLWQFPTHVFSSVATNPVGVWRSRWGGSGLGAGRSEGLTLRCAAARIEPGAVAVVLQPWVHGWSLTERAVPRPARPRRTATQPFLHLAVGGDRVASLRDAVLDSCAAAVRDAGELLLSSGLLWSSVGVAISDHDVELTEDPAVRVLTHGRFTPARCDE